MFCSGDGRKKTDQFIDFDSARSEDRQIPQRRDERGSDSEVLNAREVWGKWFSLVGELV